TSPRSPSSSPFRRRWMFSCLFLMSISSKAAPHALAVTLAAEAEHGRVPPLEDVPLARVHVHAARQARIEAPHRAHDVDAFEVLLAVLLEDRQPLYGVRVGPRRAVDVTRARVPRRRRIRVVVGDLAIANDQVMREHAAHRLVKAAAD